MDEIDRFYSANEKSQSRSIKGILIGNKVSGQRHLGQSSSQPWQKDQKRRVKAEEAQAWAKQHGLAYFETSAQSGDGVKEAFLHLFEAVHEKAPVEAAKGKTDSK